MPDKVSFLKARYCRAVLRTALNSEVEDARRLVFCLATEAPTSNTTSSVKAAESFALQELATLARRVDERGIAALSTHWQETNDAIERWIAVAYQDE